MAKKSFYKALTDDELFILLKSDRNAEAEFYRRYKIYVKGFLKHYRLNSLEREDLIQEGMIGLFQAIETFDPNRGFKFSTYSGTCIRNRINNALTALIRHKKRIGNLDVEEMVSKSDPESETIDAELSEDMKRRLVNLPEIYLKVLLGYLESKSYKVIAGELDISPKKVDNILVRIKTNLSRDIQKVRSNDKGKYPAALADAIMELIGKNGSKDKQ